MTKSEAKSNCEGLLIENGYIISGESILAPECENPEDAISIQDQLSNFVFNDDNCLQLRYEGDILKLIQIDL